MINVLTECFQTLQVSIISAVSTRVVEYSEDIAIKFNMELRQIRTIPPDESCSPWNVNNQGFYAAHASVKWSTKPARLQ